MCTVWRHCDVFKDRVSKLPAKSLPWTAGKLKPDFDTIFIDEQHEIVCGNLRALLREVRTPEDQQAPPRMEQPADPVVVGSSSLQAVSDA